MPGSSQKAEHTTDLRMFKRTLNFLEHEMDSEGQHGFRCDEMGRTAQSVHRTQQAGRGGGRIMVTYRDRQVAQCDWNC